MKHGMFWSFELILHTLDTPNGIENVRNNNKTIMDRKETMYKMIGNVFDNVQEMRSEFCSYIHMF